MPFLARAIGEKEGRGEGGERGVKRFRISNFKCCLAYKKERKHELNGALVVFLGPASECLSLNSRENDSSYMIRLEI